jgi:flavodoxin
MRTLVVYDSNFGNTKLIADEIASELKPDSRSVSVNDIKPNDLENLDLLVVGSPINAWRPTQRILWFIYKLHASKNKNLTVAAFDTRVRSIVSGNAAKKIARALTDRQFKLIEKPTGFYVSGKQGPLMQGEIQRAKDWAKSLQQQMQKY